MATRKNSAIIHVSDEEALSSCINMHSLSGYLGFGPVRLNLTGWAAFIIVCGARFVLLFFDVPSFMTLSVNVAIIMSIYWGFSPTFESLRIRYVLYVRAISRDENQVKAIRKKQLRSFYGD